MSATSVKLTNASVRRIQMIIPVTANSSNCRLVYLNFSRKRMGKGMATPTTPQRKMKDTSSRIIPRSPTICCMEPI